MTRDELVEALERGGWIDGFVGTYWGRQWWGSETAAHNLNRAYHDRGDMNAALALLAEVLPGWEWRRTPNFSIVLCSPDDHVPGLYTARPAFVGQAPTPAAALLIAILKAMEAKS